MAVRPTRVLVVDDEPWTRLVTVAAIRRSTLIEVFEADCGRAAVDTVGREAPDLVLMDYELPDLDGPAALEAILRACATGAKVIVTTTLAHERQREELIALGAADVWPKPLDLASLAEQVLAAAGSDDGNSGPIGD